MGIKPTYDPNFPACDPSLTALENARIRAAYVKERQKIKRAKRKLARLKGCKP